MNERQRRVGQNEALFRRINEEIDGLNEALGAFTEHLILVCECGKQECIDQIRLTPEEYEALRADPATFGIVPGHEVTDVEAVVSENDRFAVVRKRPGEPRELAAHEDPRAAS
jgi:hypothetical protein